MQAAAVRCASLVLGLLALGACAGRPAPPTLALSPPIAAPPPIEDAPAAAATPAAEDPAVVARPIAAPSRPRLDVLIAEEVAVLAPATVFYFLTTNLQREDFELDWDWPSWRAKLTSFDAVAFDSGNWQSNTFRHPLHGVLTYQAVRANGHGAIAATLVDLASTLIWEYVVEYRERISLNDVVVNNASGVALGEPLWQIGFLGDEPGAGVLRRGLAWLLSPIQRLHAAGGYRPWRRPAPAWSRVELGLGGGAVDHGGGAVGEVRGALAVEVRRAPGLGRAGRREVDVGLGAWSRVAWSLRGRAAQLRETRVTTGTSYAARYARALDDAGRGDERWLVLGTGFDYASRSLDAAGRDRMAVFHLLQPRITATRWDGPGRALAWELAIGGDVGMIQAHVFGPVLPFAPLPQTAVLRTRGYYYGAGLSLAARLAWDTTLATLHLAGTATALTSIDGFDRQELFGAENDPHDIADQRVWGRAAIGTPSAWLDGARVELALEATWRRGSWQRLARSTREIDLDVGVVVPF